MPTCFVYVNLIITLTQGRGYFSPHFPGDKMEAQRSQETGPGHPGGDRLECPVEAVLHSPALAGVAVNTVICT